MLHYDPQHVPSSTLIILRRTNLSPQPLVSSLWWRYQRLWWYNLSSWGWAACCSKHVEDRSV